MAALRWYGISLRWALGHRALVMFLGFMVLVGTAWEFWVIPKGFLPDSDLSQVYISTEANQGISFAAMKAHQEAVNRIVQADPSVVQFYSGISGSNSTGLNNGRAFLHLKDRPDRPWTHSAVYDRLVSRYGQVPVLDSVVRFIRPLYEHHLTIEDVIDELQPKLDTIPGLRCFLQNPPAIRIGGRLTKSLYQYTLSSASPAELYKHAGVFEAKMQALPGLSDVTSDLQIKNPQANVVVDRQKAAVPGRDAPAG